VSDPFAKPKETILEEANRIINGQRRVDYGPVEESFIDIAQRWTVELGKKLNEPLTPFDVVHLMAQMKLSRAKNGFHRDSYVDICGYAGLTEKLQDANLTPTEPRTWDSLKDVPDDVETVRSAGNAFWSFYDHAPGSRLWASREGFKVDYAKIAKAPFTEVV
jgi:hypothetical protein